LTSRVVSGHALPRDLVAIRSTLANLPDLIRIISDFQSQNLNGFKEQIHLCKNEMNLLVNSINDDPPATLQNTGIIRPGYSSELDQIVEASQHARDWINNLEAI